LARWLPLLPTLALVVSCASPPPTPPPTPPPSAAVAGALVAVRPVVPAQYRAKYPGGDQDLQLPPGFTVSVYVAGLDGPRLMTQGPDGAIYVAEKGAGRISRLPDANGDGAADAVEPFVSGLDLPHSVEWYQGSLYVGATDGIYRFAAPVAPGARGGRIVDLPARGGHSTRTIHFGPDGRMYVTIGSSCNVCLESDQRRAAMWVYDADGTNGRLFAAGLRNTVDFAFQPATGAIFGVDNGQVELASVHAPYFIQGIGRVVAHYRWRKPLQGCWPFLDQRFHGGR